MTEQTSERESASQRKVRPAASLSRRSPSLRAWRRSEDLKMSEGVIIGGWSYVVAAYVITGAGLFAYIWSLIARLRKSHNQEED